MIKAIMKPFKNKNGIGGGTADEVAAIDLLMSAMIIGLVLAMFSSGLSDMIKAKNLMVDLNATIIQKYNESITD
ncbi:hypothetical protein [Clostridium paraputrificum]|uniref:Uncharacterized protein n=1 Tax=Clostridium paraputrificum TaxID=29363 RepID=A0A6N3F6T0_9CLOT